MTPEQIKASIRTISDYPKPGIQFRDLTSLMADPLAFKASIDVLAEQYQCMEFDKIVGTEARGFIFAAPLAAQLSVGFVPARKPNKLPGRVVSQAYQLEYGEDNLELHDDAIKPGEKVLLIDDLLATGGTILAAAKLIRQLGGVVEHAGFIVSLPELGGEKKLIEAGISVKHVCEFEGL